MKRIPAEFRRGPKSSFDFRRRPKPGAQRPQSAPHGVVQPRARRPTPSESRQGWIGAGIARALLLALIVIGGVGAVVWIRDLGTAFGVQWLGNG